MIRRPPRSTLFPYTTSSDLVPHVAPHQAARAAHGEHVADLVVLALVELAAFQPALAAARARSEEHTSELQSRQYLVCRLLLEKKKNMQHSSKNTILAGSRIV